MQWREMEESGRGGRDCVGGSSDGRPPNPLAGAYRQSFGGGGGGGSHAAASPWRPALVRHAPFVKTKISDVSPVAEENMHGCDSEFIPIVRSGFCTDIGCRSKMEDAYVCCDNFMDDYELRNSDEGPNAFYGVFDGHGGKHAAEFACSNLPRFILENKNFPREIERVVSLAFSQTDNAFAEACSLDSTLESGTTALSALVVGRSLVVANAGDCRAVLCRRGKAIEMSRDHKPTCSKEWKRIEASGGSVYDGYLNGQLNVSRALGDWHLQGMKEHGGVGPLSAEPEFMRMRLTEEDEFLIIGCDGIWDVFRTQNAVDFARRKLREHNDPAACCKEMVDEALKRRSSDNLSVVVVCFHSKPPPALATPRMPGVCRSISAEGLRAVQSFLDGLMD